MRILPRHHRPEPSRIPAMGDGVLRLLVACSLLLALGGGACRTTEPEPSDWIAQAAEANRQVDEALQGGDLDRARRILVQAVAVQAPDELAPEDRRAVLQDLYFRLAEVELAAERFGAAVEWADQGLELGRAGDVFEANLLVARGTALEAMGHDRPAARDYYDAIRVNDALLHELLEETGEGGDGDGTGEEP